MDAEALLKIIVLLVGFYMAWNIGANDVSNAMGTSVGSGALTLRRAVIIAAFLEFSGAFFLGGNVSETIQKEIINISLFNSNPMILIYGMCGALLGTGIWLQTASYLGLPVSTTHAIIGAILGFGILTLGIGGVEWKMVGSIVLSWLISPLMSGIISYFIFSLIQKKILFALNPTLATKHFIPILLFFVFSTFTLSFISGGVKNLDIHLSFSYCFFFSILVGLTAFGVGFGIVKRLPLPKIAFQMISTTSPQTLISLEKAIKHLRRVRTGAADQIDEKVALLLDQISQIKQDLQNKSSFSLRTSEYQTVEKAFAFMQILSACFVAFSHGANDVANAIAPVASVLDAINNHNLSSTSGVPLWLLAFGGVGIVIGLATWGWRVIETIGKKITELTPTRGFCAEFGAAITILIASKIGLPISTTHCLVGAVLGVGFARGIRALNLRTVREIVLSWLITIPASAFTSILCYYLIKALFS